MNWVDIIIIIALAFFALESLGRPVILELLDFISFLVAFFLSFRLYQIPAQFFEAQFLIPHGLSQICGFMAVWFLSEVIFYICIRILLTRLPKFRILSSPILSIIPAILRGLVFVAFALVLLATFPIQPSIKKAVLESKIGSQILKYAYALEAPVKNVFGGVTNDSLTFLTIKPKTDQRIDLGFQTTKYSLDEVSEEVMLSLVNTERVSRGLKALTLNVDLRKIGRLYAGDMFERGYFSHYSPEGFSVADRMLQNEIDFLVVGENLAYAPSVESAHKGLMNSEGHRANILSTDYGKIGIGVMDGGIYGKMFIQVFSN